MTLILKSPLTFLSLKISFASRLASWLAHIIAQSGIQSQQYKQLYAWFGAMFGGLFPIGAVLIRFVQFGSEAAWEKVLHDPLMLIIMTAPLFLCVLARYAGSQRDKTLEILTKLKILNTQLQEINDQVQHQISLANEQSQNIEIINVQLEEVNTELREANEFKMKMLGIASHDLKNPLTNIMLQAELITRKPSDSDKTVERARNIVQSGEDMCRLITELLDATALYLGKIQLQLESCDIVQLLQTTIDSYQVQLNAKQQNISIHAPSSLIMQCDPARIRQALENLLSNAVKYSVIGGDIGCSLREHPLAEGIIEFRIKDSGPGFTEEDKSKLFVLFQCLSAKPTGGETSSGVGLASVKNIIELHGGGIDLETTPEKGSTFIVCLPQFQASP